MDQNYACDLITRDPEPELDPPQLLVGSKGFLSGPYDDVKLLPEKHISSHTDLPTICPPKKKPLKVRLPGRKY